MLKCLMEVYEGNQPHAFFCGHVLQQTISADFAFLIQISGFREY